MKLKSVRIKAINWSAQFESVNGSYYDYATTIYAPSEAKEKEIRDELVYKGWQEIVTDDSLLLVFVRDRHVIRVHRIWD